MTEVVPPLEVTAGDTKIFRLTLVEVTGDTSSPLDLAGARVTWALGKRPQAQPLVTKTIGAGITVESEQGGIVRISLVPTDTEVMAAGRYYHECEVIDAQGGVDTVAKGYLTILPDLIRHSA